MIFAKVPSTNPSSSPQTISPQPTHQSKSQSRIVLSHLHQPTNPEYRMNLVVPKTKKRKKKKNTNKFTRELEI